MVLDSITSYNIIQSELSRKLQFVLDSHLSCVFKLTAYKMLGAVIEG